MGFQSCLDIIKKNHLKCLNSKDLIQAEEISPLSSVLTTEAQPNLSLCFRWASVNTRTYLQMAEWGQHVRRLCGYCLLKEYALPRGCCLLWIINLKYCRLFLDVDGMQKSRRIVSLTSVIHTDWLTCIQDFRRQIMIKNHWSPVKQ